ncbi:MAG: hypothetical protein J6X98_07425 [Bacteroidales bacterium]|nr:hypothetical protein [Bacteroidales bacterium]
MAQYFFIPTCRNVKNVIFAVSFRPKPKGAMFPSVVLFLASTRAGDGHIKGVESTSYLRRIELRKFNIHPHDKAMVNVHGLYIHKTDIPQYSFRYTYSVGFGIAYPRMEGNAKA